LAFVFSLFVARQHAPLLFVAMIAAIVAAIVPLQFASRVAGNPMIHDITTDFDDPPKIVAAAGETRKNPATYLGAEPVPKSELTLAEAQRSAFPDIQPIFLDLNVEDVFSKSRSAIDKMGMETLATKETKEEIVIEATDTSFWFGFVDDFIIRIRPDDKKTRIDLRSKSRVGISDLGANAARMREFLSHFRG
jgi:uncharacterized protein (DUF1499 family)